MTTHNFPLLVLIVVFSIGLTTPIESETQQAALPESIEKREVPRKALPNEYPQNRPQTTKKASPNILPQM